MQSELNFIEVPASSYNGQKTVYYRPKGYSQRLLQRMLLFLFLPSTLILLLLPIVFKTPLLFAVAAVTLPLLALITFVTYKNAAGNCVEVSAYGLQYHEAASDYSISWGNVEALGEVRLGFTKVRGVKLRERAAIQTKGWYETMETIGNILAIFTISPSPSSSSQGSPSTKGGRFIPVGLFAPNDLDYQSELWQQISQNAPWLFDPTAKAERLPKIGEPQLDWDQKVMEMIAKNRKKT